MKKIILALLAFTCLFNLTPALGKEDKELQAIKEVMINPKESDEKRNLTAALVFGGGYIQNEKVICDENGIINIGTMSNTSLKELNESLIPFTKEGIDITCFEKRYNNEFVNKTDECILQRRNNKGPAKTCWYDYKKFLPESSKINTEDEFIYMAKAAIYYNTTNYCEKAPELTTQERKECYGKVVKYITQLSNKTAPHCRDIIPEKYNQTLQASKDLLTTVNDTKVVNAFGQEKQGETLIFQAIYGNAYAKQALMALQALGYQNFCTTEGFEKDIKKLSGKNLFDKKNSNEIELN